jgi:molecular chaperone GrpE (heat shock protein)
VDRHQNPANDTEAGDLSRVSRLLSSSLSSRLGDSSVSLSQEQYEIAKDYVGPEYREGLGRYFEVAAQTETESDDQLAEQFNRTSRQQQRLADRLEEFNETRREYREARQAGNDTRAEQLARQLRRQADDIERTGSTIVRDYSTISNETGVNLTDASNLLNETLAQRLAETREIQDQQFSRTRIEVSTTSTEASFVQPVEIDGSLRSNESAIANRSIQLEIGTQTLETRTDDDGEFTLEYRPVAQPLGQQDITVQFVPRNESNLQRSNGTITTTITQVEPDVRLEVSPEETQFNETIRITGAVTAGGISAPSTPLSVSFANRTIIENETTRTGEINESIRVPLRATEGLQPVRVRVGASNQSLDRQEATTFINVTPTPAQLSLNATKLNQSGSAFEQRTVIVRGRLTTLEDGVVEGEQIQLTINERVVGTARTDETGLYETTIEIPQGLLPTSVGGEENVPITAVYEAENTGLEATETTSTVLVQAELLAVIGRNFSPVESLAALVIIGGSVVLRFRYDQRVARREETPADTASTETSESPDPMADTSLLEVASRFLDSGRPNEAVQFAYGATRERLSEAYDIADGHNTTHWEFYHACRDAMGDRLDGFDRLTALYERSAFDSESVETTTANEAQSLATELTESVGTDESDEPSTSTTSEGLPSDD